MYATVFLQTFHMKELINGNLKAKNLKNEMNYENKIKLKSEESCIHPVVV